MAWTIPADWTTSELVIASKMNTHVRDNLNYLYSQIASQFFLSAGGGAPSTTNGCDGALQIEFTTNDRDFVGSAFAPDVAEIIQWTSILPTDYGGGTITAKFYWYSPDGGTDATVWALQASAIDNSDPLDDVWGGAQTVIDDSNANNDLNITASTPAISIANSPAAGNMVQFRGYRSGNSVDDTMATDAILLMVVVNYTRA